MDVRTVIAIVTAALAVVTVVLALLARREKVREDLVSIATCLLIIAGCFQLASATL